MCFYLLFNCILFYKCKVDQPVFRQRYIILEMICIIHHLHYFKLLAT